MSVESLMKLELIWEKTTDSEFPYRVLIGTNIYCVRINNFPEEEMFTLLENGLEAFSFDNWPKLWTR